MRWTEDASPAGAARPGRWVAGLLAAAAVGVALVGGLTAVAPAGVEREAPRPPAVVPDGGAEPTGGDELLQGTPTPSPTPSAVPTLAPLAPPEPVVVPAPSTAQAPPAAVPAADVVPVGEPGRACPFEGATAVSQAGRALVCTAPGGSDLRWRQA
ncbi:hypothetical protein [Geodermatophilus sp. SYSU D00815]